MGLLLQAVDRHIELSTYITWNQLTGTDLHQIPDLRSDLIYLKVSTALPLQVRNHFANHPYHHHFIEFRANVLHRVFIMKVEKAITGLQAEDFIENQILEERLLNPLDPFCLG
jgi:hypothetical protein